MSSLKEKFEKWVNDTWVHKDLAWDDERKRYWNTEVDSAWAAYQRGYAEKCIEEADRFMGKRHG